MTSPAISGQSFQVSQITQNNTQSGFNPKNPYGINFYPTFNSNSYNMQTGSSITSTLPLTCNLWGYQKPFSS